MKALAIFVGCLLALHGALCIAQSKAAPIHRVDPSARRDQLAEVGQKLADPDPDARAAYMESIVASGDATLIRKAIGLALRSDDATLHNLGLRAFLASVHELTFNVDFPERLKGKIEDAQLDPEAMKSLNQSLPWLQSVQRGGGTVHVGIFKYSFSSDSGGWSWNPNHADWGHYAPNDGSFTIEGDHLTGQVGWADRLICTIAVRTTADLALRGTLNCTPYLRNSPVPPALPISTPIQ
jgi:hypothetical protein